MQNKSLKSTPKKDNFRMPAEWEKQQEIWILWPERTDNWREKAKPAQEVFTKIIKTITMSTPVIVGANPNQYQKAKSYLKNIKNVKLIEIANDDSWIRDSGMTVVVNDETKEMRAIDWEFNAWGGLIDGLYDSWDQDNLVASKMAEYYGIKRYHTKNFVLEGGSFHVDGQGTVLTTEACLLSEGRNPKMSKLKIENMLKEYLNVTKVIWLPHGIFNDETNEHVDNIANFAPNNKVLLAWTDNQEDPQYKWSKQAYDILINETAANGKPFEIIKVHIPNTIKITNEEANGVDIVDGTLQRMAGDRQAASYVNFLITNQVIILPIFNDQKRDKEAISTIKKAFPGYKIKPIYSREIILGGGNIHCISQQIPKLDK